MAITRSTRRRVGAYALIVSTLTLVAGLLAMHGLPMVPSHSMPMSAVVPMTGQPVDMSTETAIGAVDHVGVQAPNSPAMVCSASDHCTTTLRSAASTATPCVCRVVTEIRVTVDAGPLTASPAPIAHPPDLDTLQISRT